MPVALVEGEDLGVRVAEELGLDETQERALPRSVAADQADDLAGTDGIPNRLLDRVETNVFIPIGQSVMISGVNARSMTRNTMGIPWLNRIPVLGYLFGSEHKDAESIYGVVFITPTIVQDSPAMSKRQIDQALEYFESPRKLPR